jgi:hypothetical protein
MHSGGYDVVRGLAAIHVVVRMHQALHPRGPPSSSLARLASTSFMFMLVWVPEPVCQITRGTLARANR